MCFYLLYAVPEISNSANMSDLPKAVLVSLRDRKRVVHFTGSKGNDLLPAVKTAFGDLLNDTQSLVLQLKDEDWGGAFIDLQDQEIQDRSELRIVVQAEPAIVPQQVCVSEYY